MAIEVVCPCGKRLTVKADLAGKRVACPSCGSPVAIPALPSPTASASAISVTCPCGQRLSAKPGLAGKTVRCPACQQPLQVPLASNASSLADTAPPLSPQATDSPWEDLPVTGSAAPSRPSKNTVTSTSASVADELLAQARAKQVQRQKDADAWGTGKIISGIAMTVGGVLWLGLCLLVGKVRLRNYVYGLALLAGGLIALINGIAQKAGR